MTRPLSYPWCSSTIFLRLVISHRDPASPQRAAAYQNSAMRFVSPNAPDLVENAKRIKCPVLFIRGDQEQMENIRRNGLKKTAPGDATSRSVQPVTTSSW